MALKNSSCLEMMSSCLRTVVRVCSTRSWNFGSCMRRCAWSDASQRMCFTRFDITKVAVKTKPAALQFSKAQWMSSRSTKCVPSSLNSLRSAEMSGNVNAFIRWMFPAEKLSDRGAELLAQLHEKMRQFCRNSAGRNDPARHLLIQALAHRLELLQEIVIANCSSQRCLALQLPPHPCLLYTSDAADE